ncbi:hypothetical protein QMA10_07735 [Arthrobacter sp. APC 3897]|uniref:hypothetical protein n=1 Tax=Arthrobacter sp. APC 3897 TaxID=3035204 RepID=UPI0025B59202|nr:hypothetical protein [Arthrobacter sp. APC 3897]MDN3481813.1 hypothetical protein [Arthrobacter sp. APC 3897]
METNGSLPSLDELRHRQTELVTALSVETSAHSLAALSAELETVLEQIQQHEGQTR